ncbi:hypothetical protein [Paenibacillus azoreducens]|uniref:Uncharacterized protein n=1 Tax=Paenibacillus azoreducens TaxID=116718 RepID=A0A920CSB0_9BACL|nr:hypothetical protein [Paenibacillus azoreducens]GIO47248.1 hypothetical protein J34TS1_20130 [Paenibacillus azoreducens]
MADVSKRLAKGKINGDYSPLTIYQVPSGKRTFIKAMTFCNMSNQDIDLSLTFADTDIIKQHKIKGYDTITIPYIDQIIESGEKITISVSLKLDVSYYISGREVDV